MIRYEPKPSKIKRCMQYQGMTYQFDLAEASGVSRITVGKMLRGQIAVTHSTAEVITEALRCELTDIFEEITIKMRRTKKWEQKKNG